jgi:hypothetical protein
MVALPILFILYPASNNGFDYSSLNHLYILPLYLAAAASIFSGYIYLNKGMKEI